VLRVNNYTSGRLVTLIFETQEIERKAREYGPDRNLPFGGLFVIMLGDPFQSKLSSIVVCSTSNVFITAVEGAGRSLIKASCTPNDPAGILFRNFKKFSLTEQMRASDDLKQTEFLEMLRKPLTYPFPMESGKFFTHVQVLTHTLAEQDSTWITESTLLTARNATRFKANLTMAAEYANKMGLPIIAWHHDLNANTQRLFDAQVIRENLSGSRERTEDVTLFDVMNRFDQLVFYFVPGAPMVINHNISIKLGIVNGAMGTLHSMVLDPKHFNKDQEQIKNKWREIDDTAPGQVHWLDQPPLHVNVQIKKAVGTEWTPGSYIEESEDRKSVVIPMCKATYATELDIPSNREMPKSKHTYKFYDLDLELGYVLLDIIL
jgi:hypothetical protein